MDVGDPEFVARVGAERVVRGERARDLVGQVGIEAAFDVDPGQLNALGGGLRRELDAFAGQVGALGVGLAAD